MLLKLITIAYFLSIFSARDIEPVQSPIPPPLPPSPIPLFNPREIQLGRKHGLLAEAQSSTNEQGENPFRKTANGRD